tara:strand:- start:243 stop:941 length:699 start_codon:yes stop_codon:yes gene_type:complete
MPNTRAHTHDPVSGLELPSYVYLMPTNTSKGKTFRYKLKLPQSHCREQGVRSKCVIFTALSELLASDAYSKVLADDQRHYRDGKRSWRSKESRKASVDEYERMVRDGVSIHPDLQFRRIPSIWAITRTFGTGWTFRATAHSYSDAMRLHRECAKVRSVEEVVGNEATEARKRKKCPVARKMLARGDASDEGEEAEVVAVEVVEEDEEDEEEEEEEVDGFTLRSSRCARAICL